jgi:[acyl-carrier-protein] S-malonyltransferase
MSGYAFLFPGQASQTVGMGQDLYELSDAVRAIFDEADQVMGTALTKLCFEGPAEELSQTAVTQPAVFVHSVAALRLLAAGGLEPQCVAGHSLGEYSALVAAGVLEFSDALKLVVKRGRLMQEAGEKSPGKMAAIIGLDDQAVADLCGQTGEGAVPANYNAPGQVVVSGEVAAVDQVQELAREAGAKRVIELPVSGAFHSRLMAPAAEELEELLKAAPLASPRVPVVTNVAASPARDAEELRQQLIRQMTHPVRWTESIRAIAEMGVGRAAEVGPGSVIKGLVRRIAGDLEVVSAGTAEDIPKAIESLGRHGGS